jgi:hypothetical protein
MNEQNLIRMISAIFFRKIYLLHLNIMWSVLLVFKLQKAHMLHTYNQDINKMSLSF